jgi:HEAT repeat protein
MSDPDREIRRKAAWDLARSGPEGAARLLAMYTGDGSDASELARHGLWGARRDSVPVLMEALRSGTDAQKELALRFLPRFDDTSTRNALLSHLAENESAAGVVLKVLADGGHALRVATLKPYTQHPDPEVRTQAARILGRSKRHSYSSRKLKAATDAGSEEGESYRILVSMLKDDAASVRAAAACGIGHHDYATGIDRLIPLFDDSDFSVQACAARSVRLLDNRWYTRLWAKEILPGLMTFLGSTGSWSRDFALKHLPLIDPGWQRGAAAEEAVARLSARLRTGTDEERYWAAWGLGHIATPSAGSPLADAILDNSRDVQRHARASIVNVGRPAVEHLMRNIGEGEESSQLRTMAALRDITGLSFGRSPKQWNHWWHTEGKGSFMPQAKK